MTRISYNTIIRFFHNECTPEEKEQIMRWVNESPEHATQFFKWEEAYHIGHMPNTINDFVLHNAEKKLFKRIEDEEKRSLSRYHLIHKIKYAAVIIALITVGGLAAWYTSSIGQNEWIVASTSIGETKELTLPDSSKVWLNENSTLSYPKEFDSDERELKLNGEAYFEVTKNKHKPFIVYSPTMSVEVLGTKFNFKSTPNCRITETSLIEGEVKVRGNHDEGAITLSPGQKVELNTVTGQMKVSEADVKLDAIWHDNLIPLENTDIFQMAEILEKVYNVKIILSPDINSTATYSGVLKRKDSIEDVLKLLQNTIHLHYKIHQGTIFISSE